MHINMIHFGTTKLKLIAIMQNFTFTTLWNMLNTAFTPSSGQISVVYKSVALHFNAKVIYKLIVDLYEVD